MKEILCIRLDNMGDVLMSTPAIRALKNAYNSRITLLTSSAGAQIAESIPEIDEVIISDVPWMKHEALNFTSQDFMGLVDTLKFRGFDAAVIFTVYSQNPLATALMAYLAEIPIRVAYCRENPYGLLTHWIPEEEPFAYIRHQVQRDLDLAALTGAVTEDHTLSLEVDESRWPAILQKLTQRGVNAELPWIILHPGVSDAKRQYPIPAWISVAQRLIREMNVQLLITGVEEEYQLAETIREQVGESCFNLAGAFELEDFITLIRHSRLVISVNTGTVHIAAATNTPVLVLYALTNPQHTPWKVNSMVLYFDIPEELMSKNGIIRYVHDRCVEEQPPLATEENIMQAAAYLMVHNVMAFTAS
jgi:lipopolysaccharide heptosyltransferase II